MSPPRRPQHDLRDLPAHQRRELEDLDEKTKLETKLRFYTEIGPIRRAGVWDTKCPKCGTETRPAKTYCQGRNPEHGLEANCYIVGDHLHVNCPSCNFAWVERCNDDELDLPTRGGLRYDEVYVQYREEGDSIQPAPSLNVHERWNVPYPPEPEKEK